MTDRERLIKLIRKAERQECIDALTADIDTAVDMPRGEEYLADYLLANGVICPPCKVGDTVYEILPKAGYIRAVNVVGFHLGKFPTLRGHKRKEYFVGYLDQYLLHIRIDDIGKTVFLSREEAEKALAERSKE